jgi:cytochrome b561
MNKRYFHLRERHEIHPGFLLMVLLILLSNPLRSQITPGYDSLAAPAPSTGWADEAATVGYIAAPAVVGLMFISALVNEWNAGYAGIPASSMILIGTPLIYAGARSAGISRESHASLARLGWTLYAISIIPTSLALYGFTTDSGATVPLTLASGILGSASLFVMSAYASARAKEARLQGSEADYAWSFGIIPLAGGAMASVGYRF